MLYAKRLVHRDGRHGEVIEHGGGIFGFLTDARYYPDEKLTLVVRRSTVGPALVTASTRKGRPGLVDPAALSS